MKLFSCPSCANLLYFENRLCGRCGQRLGYDAATLQMLTLGPRGGAHNPSGRFLCQNAEQDVCNWLAPEGALGGFCIACRHSGTVPDIGFLQNLEGWRELEDAKHRLFYSLLRWRLPLRTRLEDPLHGLIFHFLADTPANKVMTGHENGVITIALAEADAIERERRRVAMN